MAGEGLSLGEISAVVAIKDAFTEVLKRAKEAISSLGPTFEKIGVGVGIAVAAVAAITASVMYLGKRGADIADVSTAFRRFTADAGGADAVLAQLRAGTVNTIDSFSLMKQANVLLSAGVKLTADDFGVLGRAAHAVSDATGQDMKASLESLSDALVTGKTKSLAFLGITIDSKKAVEDYAHAHGLAKDALTGLGEKEAIRSVILQKLRDYTKEAGDGEVDFADRIEQVKTAITNATDALAVAISESPVLAQLIGTVADALTSAFGDNQTETIKTLVGWINQGAIALVGLAEVGVSTAKYLTQGFYGVRALVFAFAEAVTNVVAQVFDDLATGAEVLAKIPGIGDRFKGMATSLREATDVSDAMAKSFKDTKTEAVDAATAAGKGFDGFNDTIESLRQKMIAASSAEVSNADITNDLGKRHQSAAVLVKDGSDALDAYLKSVNDLSGGIREAMKHTDDIDVFRDKFGGAMKSVFTDAAALGQKVPKIVTDMFIKIAQDDNGAVIRKQFADIAAGMVEDQKKFIDDGRAAFSTNQDAMTTAMRDAVAVRMRLSGDEYGAAKYAIENEKFDRQAALDVTGANYKEAMAAIAADTDAKMAEAEHAYKDHLAEMEAATNSWGRIVQQTIGGIPALLQKAFTGGGGLAGALSASLSGLGASVGQKLFEGPTGLGQMVAGGLLKTGGMGASMAGMIGGAVGGVATMGLSLAAPLVIAGIKKLFHNSEKEINPQRQAFVDAAGGLELLDVKAHKAGVTLTKLLDAKNPKQYKAAIDDLNAAFKFQDDSMKTLDETIGRYKFSIEELGPALGKQNLDKQAQQIFQDWSVLNAAGIDTTAITREMSSGVSDYIQNALKMGQEIPANMKPMLDKMVEMGQLTDANGNVITDLKDAGVTFSETMTQGFQKIVDSVGKLTDAISRGLGLALNNIPQPPPIHIPVIYDNQNAPGDGTENGGPQAAGGDYLVTRPTRFLAGESGPERVTFSGGMNAGNGGGGDAAAEVARLRRDFTFMIPNLIAKATATALAKEGL